MTRTTPLALSLAASLALVACGGTSDDSEQDIRLSQVGRFETGIFDEGAAEIVAHDPGTQRLFVVNADATTVDVLDIANPSTPTRVGTIDAGTIGASANSVAVADGIVAVAIEAEDAQADGQVAFFNAGDLGLITTVTVGALPDMVTFTPDGKHVLVANEGEPSDDYATDPEGSVSLIDLSAGVNAATATHLDFRDFNGRKAELRAAGARIFGPGASVAEDLEPEYITVSEDGDRAWVSLQENNALAEIDLTEPAITAVRGLGAKDHSLPGNEIDGNNDDGVNIAQRPVFGLYQPDAVASFRIGGTDYVITANEGDAREYDAFEEETEVGDVTLDPTAFPNAAGVQAAIGPLKITSALGDEDGDGDYDALYAFGARSFSIWSDDGLVADSGSDFARITAARYGESFNNDNDENDGDSRSDNKGSEPEALDVGEVDGATYAFIGLERMGGIMVYEVTDPDTPRFVEYVNNRDLGGDPEAGTAGDLGPEGIVFIPATASPVDAPLLAVGNEVSGSTTLYRIDTIERED